MSVTFRKVKALLRRDYERAISIRPNTELKFHRITLTTAGILKLMHGYAWDHASGAFDTETIIEGALVHDALSELIHNGLLPDSYWDVAAEIMYDININSEPKMWKGRAKWIRRVIKIAGPDVTKAREWITIGG